MYESTTAKESYHKGMKESELKSLKNEPKLTAKSEIKRPQIEPIL